MENLNFVKNTDKLNSTNTLDREFKKFIHTDLSYDKGRLEIYNYVMNQLINNDMIDYLNEMKYKITDGENPNKVILDIINKNKTTKAIFWNVKKKIEEYLDEDLYDKFYG